MPTQIIRAGASVRVIINPRAITQTSLVDGYLIISYSDGTIENAGFLGAGSIDSATIYNTTGSSNLPSNVVSGFAAIADSIDARLTALGV